MSWTVKRDFLIFFKRERIVKVSFGLHICMPGAVARLLLSEKRKCYVAIWAKIKVWLSCMYLFTIEW